MKAGAPGPSGRRQYPVGPPTVPHRKNAAEWVMWAVLWPLAIVARWAARFRGRDSG